MNTRLQQFLKAENISQSQFANTLGITRASVTHIISGRNRPGYEFFSSLGTHFPTLNLQWLITGKGKMYLQSPTTAQIRDSQTLFTPENTPALPSQPIETQIHTTHTTTPATHSPNLRESLINKSVRKISKVIVFFDDGSFKEIE